MKLLASALSLVLVGLTGIWLWFDATAEARQDLPGVVVSADQDPGVPAVRQPVVDGDAVTAERTDPAAPVDSADAAAVTTDPAGPAGEDRETLDSRMVALSSVLGTLRASRGELTDLATAAADQAAEEKAEKRAADEKAAAEKAAAEKAAEEEAGSSGGSGSTPPAPAPQPAPVPLPPPPSVPQPVQPAPVTPPGMCWDDDEWEECDDDGR